jgi:hypothetical protein
MKQLKMTPEEKAMAMKYWQYRKAKARNEIKGVALIGCPMFMTCSEELNKGLMEKKKEMLKWAKREIKFADENIKKLKSVMQ